jgi:hypothetical protein
MAFPNLTTVQTDYNPKATKNLKPTFRKNDLVNRWKVTEEERSLAKNCRYPGDLHDFTEAVRFLLEHLVMLK